MTASVVNYHEESKLVPAGLVRPAKALCRENRSCAAGYLLYAAFTLVAGPPGTAHLNQVVWQTWIPALNFRTK